VSWWQILLPLFKGNPKKYSNRIIFVLQGQNVQIFVFLPAFDIDKPNIK
jgi:hypothetical protein